MGIIGWIVFGFIIGLIARAIVPGRQHMGFIATTVLGIIGSVLGGLVGSAIAGRSLAEWHTAGVIGSLIGAIVVLLVAGGMFTGRRRATV